MCSERRICDDLGHSRAYRHRGSTVAAKITIATSLWGSGDLLILWQPSRSVQRPAHAGCSPKPTASLGTRSTACGRQVLSLVNAWWRRGGQRALSLHPPALPNSRSGHRCDGSRLLVDLGRSVDLEALRPLARRNRCRQRSRSRSARAHGLPRPGGLADGRVGRHGVASRVPRSYWDVRGLS